MLGSCMTKSYKKKNHSLRGYSTCGHKLVNVYDDMLSLLSKKTFIHQIKNNKYKSLVNIYSFFWHVL